MTTLKASILGLARIKQARKEKGWSVDNPKWLEEATRVLGINWEETGYFAEGISEGTWKRFLAGKRPIKAEAFKAYSEVLGLSWEELIERGSVQDWGEAPESGVFYGRTEELATLKQWIVQDRCRLVTLLGMGGIGKTAVAVKLVESLQDQFQYFIWRSLRYAPPLEDILTEFLQFLSPSPKTALPTSFSARFSQLIECLRKQRCLLVLDNFEAILGDSKSSNRSGTYLDGYEPYGELLRRVGESQHQSSLLLISREKPKEITALASQSLPIRSLQLGGLQELEARQILQEKGLSGEEEWATLIKLYRGNPLALNLVAATIQDLFKGNVSLFIEQGTFIVVISDILEQHFSRLSEIEQEVMYWLAIHSHPVSLPQLQADSLLPIAKSDLIEVLVALGGRSLIEKTTESDQVLFTLQPVVMKYVTKLLVTQVCEEIFQGKVELLRSHSLSPTEVLIDSNQGQNRSLIITVKNRLLSQFRSESSLVNQLTQILSTLSNCSKLELGYSATNLQALLAELNQNV